MAGQTLDLSNTGSDTKYLKIIELISVDMCVSLLSILLVLEVS